VRQRATTIPLSSYLNNNIYYNFFISFDGAKIAGSADMENPIIVAFIYHNDGRIKRKINSLRSASDRYLPEYQYKESEIGFDRP